MKRFRSHITQFLVALLICTGLSLSWVQPAHANQSSYAFARWLRMMTHSAEASDLHKQLQRLQESEGTLEDMLKKASRILAENNEEFDFPFAKENTSRSLYNALLVEWNQYQTGNAMANIPVQQKLKPLVPVHTNKKVEGAAFTMPGSNPFVLPVYRTIRDRMQTVEPPSAISPMSDGIAIGAP